jgi:lactate dehydrogenase-like 2-hydroxyacid dehydrogenase
MTAQTGYLIMVSRGRLMTLDALVEAIRTKRIASAGLDVTEPAEPLPKGHPLLEVLKCHHHSLYRGPLGRRARALDGNRATALARDRHASTFV